MAHWPGGRVHPSGRAKAVVAQLAPPRATFGALLGVVLGIGACGATVRLEVPPSPAVAISDDTVAVVAGERACQAAADALALELPRSSYLIVDPRAPVRVELLGCGDDQVWTLEQEAGPDGARRRTRVEARAHALVQVSDQGRVLAHLIGAGREDNATAWQQPAGSSGLFQFRRQTRHRVHEDLARDIVRQLNPLPTLVQRRVYPNAPAGTSRELVTLAVRAEQAGDVVRALQLAEAAWLQDPNPHTAGYVQELKRLHAAAPR
jgi:hypothetical protein